MKKKRYTRYEVEDRPKRRWKRIVLWSGVGLVVVVLLVAAGSYLWFRAQVSSANNRVTPEIRAALLEKPSTKLTTEPVQGTTTTFKEPSPSAMNLLVLGSDRRPNDPSIGGRSDTLMIVHIDPEQNYLSVLSLPRDLRVDIPGHGKGKLNTAFAYGGPALAIQTIQQTTGVDINHYLEIGFTAFSDIVNSLGGVYVDVDKRYYNNNWNYEPIDLYPGYQLLNGAQALDYVRFRHDYNMDFGRMERQQRFMTAVREQAMGWNLPFKLPGLIAALFRNVTTDLDANQILRLTAWAVGLNGDNIRTITLTGATPTIDGIAYVTVTENQLAQAVDELLYSSASEGSSTTSSAQAAGSTTATDATQVSGTGTAGVGTVAEGETTTSLAAGDFSGYASSTSTTGTTLDIHGVTVNVAGASGRNGEAGAAAQWLQSLGINVGTTSDNSGSTAERSAIEYPGGLFDEAKQVAAATKIDQLTRTSRVDRVTVVLGEDFVLPAAFALPPTPANVPDAARWKQWAAQTPYAVEAPAYLPDGYAWVRRFPDNYPTYGITVGNGTQPAFRMMYAAQSNPDQVLGITETTWLDAPIASKGLQVTHNGVVFTVVRNATDVVQVWWKSNGVLYFVSNTISYWLDQDEMLKIAESMIAIPAQ